MNYLITIAGPTGIGKTALSIALAQHFQCDILSADSRQFYKEMRIGTAVPSKEELQAATHHFIHQRSIHESYSVGDFEKEALEQLDSLFQNNNKAILVGGSGLYIQAVLEGLDYFPDVPAEIREQLNRQWADEGLESLQRLLKEKDLETYQVIDLKNPHRVVRALEVYLASGKPFSYFKKKQKAPRNFKPVVLGLTAERRVVYQRIDARVDQMIEQGLLREAERLYPYRTLNALQTVGYKELFDYMDGKISLEFAISEIKKNSRRYAKRQYTWFKKVKGISWINYATPTDEIIKLVESQVTY